MSSVDGDSEAYESVWVIVCQAMVLLTDALQTLTRATIMRPEQLSTHLRHRGEATEVLA